MRIIQISPKKTYFTNPGINVKRERSNMWSFWERQSFIGQPDVTVIGSGIVGLSAAIEIKQSSPQTDVLIVEAGELPSGASTKNAGFACFGSPSELLMDLRSIPENLVFEILKMRYDGLILLKELLGEEAIGYDEPGSYELFEDDSNQYIGVLETLSYLNQQCANFIGFKPYIDSPEIVKKNGFIGFEGAVRILGEGQINTGKMMKRLLDKAQKLGIRFLNGLTVNQLNKGLSNWEVECDKGVFLSQLVLVATNGFAKKLLPQKDVEPARAQVLITEELDSLPFEGTYHFDSGYYYFRNIGRRMLFGGARNLDFETERTTENALNEKIQTHLLERLKNNILPGKEVSIAHQWTGIMGVGLNKMPIVEKIDEGLFCAVKLGGMGIAIGSATGIKAGKMLLQS